MDERMLNESMTRAENIARQVVKDQSGSGSSLIANVLLTLIILAIVGVLGFGFYDYYKTKKNLTSQIDGTGSNLSREIVNRSTYGATNDQTLTNLVSDINNVHTGMEDQLTGLDTTMSENIAITNSSLLAANSNIAMTSNSQAAFVKDVNSGLGSYFSVNGQKTNSFFGDLQTNPNADLSLLKHVMLVNGLSATDLSSTNSVQLCGPSSASGSNCIQIPDAEGNIALTPFGASNKILLNGQTMLTASSAAAAAASAPGAYSQARLYVNGPAVFNTTPAAGGADILGWATTSEGNVGIGTSSPSNCKVQINPGPNGTTGLKVMDGSGKPVLTIDSNVTIGSKLYFGANATSYIGADSAGLVIGGPLKLQDPSGNYMLIDPSQLKNAATARTSTITNSVNGAFSNLYMS